MKRIVALFLVIVSVLSFTGACCDSQEILFRGIPWGSDAKTVKKELKKSKIGFYLFDHSVVAVSFIRHFVSARYGLWSGDSGVTTYSSENKPKIKVAGYKPEDMEVFFVYRPVDGNLVFEDQYAALYAGAYLFTPKNVSGMFDDLKNKLSSVYGNCTYAGGEEILDDLFGESGYFYFGEDPVETFAIWESDLAYLMLIGRTYPENADSTFYKDSVTIVYISKEADIWIQEALAARDGEIADLEADQYGNGNTDGL